MKYEALKKQAQSEWEEFTRKDRLSILIGSGTCGRAAGSLDVFSAL